MSLFSKSLTFLVVLILCCRCGSDNQARTWSVYKADSQSTSYSPLKDINTENASRLQIAWKFIPGDELDSSRTGSSECNPIIVDGVMYLTSARHRLYAVDAVSGKLVWSFDPFEGKQGGGICRGVAYWEDGEDKRILYTAGDHLFAQDARTGKLISGFGQAGKVSLNEGMRGDPETISVIPTSPGVIFKDIIIMGAEVSELYGAQPGDIRAYNVKTGKKEWTFHTIPHPGEAGYETWPKDAWKYAGGVNDWAGMSLDQKRGMVFLALGSPAYDFYGGDRIGKNLYGNSIVALDARTGQYRWHFQTVHHDLWDYDLPAPPNLVNIQRDGKAIDAVAQTTKTGFVFLLNRDTGEPLFPTEERKVPATNVPGEQSWPTQPFPLKPKPYSRQLMTIEDLTAFSPALHDSLVKKMKSLRYEGLFTPPDLRGTLMLPGTRGGSNWGGGAVDPETGTLFVKGNDSPEIDLLQKVQYQKSTPGQPAYFQGKALYTNYCANCHGKDKNGNEPLYPSLIGLQKKMSREGALKKIRQGGGQMPGFAALLKGKEDAIISYLYDFRPSRKDRDLQEIGANRLSLNHKEDSSKADTASLYLNLTAFGHFNDPAGNPSIKPPWGTLSAINLATGEYEWQIPLGNIPELQTPGAPPTGAGGSGGPIVTAGGLVFIGSTYDKKFRAFEKDSGKLIWETELPGIANATPCTYRAGGKQFVAVSVSGDRENPGGYVVAFGLP